MSNDPHELLNHACSGWRTARLLGYIDPGTGSYAFQMLIAGVTGVLFFFTSVKRKVMSLFTKAGPETAREDVSSLKDSPTRESADKSVAH